MSVEGSPLAPIEAAPPKPLDTKPLNGVGEEAPKPKSDDDAQTIAVGLAVLAAVAAAVVFGWLIWVAATQFTQWQDILSKHFAAIVGLPGGAAVAFALVVFLRQTDGPMELDIPGFKLKGSAGQVIMWVICFLAIAAAIKLVW